MSYRKTFLSVNLAIILILVLILVERAYMRLGEIR
jgi:hypothetical protein